MGQEKKKKSRDCSLREWLDGFINYAPEELLREHGIEKKAVEQKPLFHIQDCPAHFKPMRALLEGVENAANPVPAGWIPFTAINVAGRYLVPCDLGQVPQGTDTPAIEVRPGPYQVEVRLARSHQHERCAIAAVRVVQDCVAELSLIKKFEIDIDLAAVSIFDRQQFFKRVPLNEREAFGSDLMDVVEKPCVAMTGKTDILVIPSGHGDGTYPVYQLASNGVSYGMEIHFIDTDYASPL